MEYSWLAVAGSGLARFGKMRAIERAAGIHASPSLKTSLIFVWTRPQTIVTSRTVAHTEYVKRESILRTRKEHEPDK